MKTNTAPRYTVIDRLAIEVHPDRPALGRAAARAVAGYLRDVIARQGAARVIFACAASQDEFFAALVDPALCGAVVDWSRVTAFHMDDYLGMRGDDPRSFRYYMHTHLLKHVQIGRFHPLNAEEPDTAAECARYAALLTERPIDLICMGIGENGHIAFNDPPVAEFDDETVVKVIEIDDTTREQYVKEGFFPTLGAVPSRALTITVPVFRHAARLSIHVPGKHKAAAVRAAVHDKIAPVIPASILRTHPDATLYLDEDSAHLAEL